MKLSTRGRYGTRALAELATYHGKGPVMLEELARRQHISRRYLEHIFADLKSSGLVKGMRGPHGGYVLTREPANIRISEIVKAVEGPLSIVDCLLGEDRCELAVNCMTRPLWKKVTEAIEDVLDSTTLADLAPPDRTLKGKLPPFEI